jgi:hypothetical protein
MVILFAGFFGLTNLTSTFAQGTDHLVLSPSTATITAGDSQAYTAEGYDTYNNDLGDVTAETTLSIHGGGSCNNTAHTCTSSIAGDHTVTSTDGIANGTATLTVTADQTITFNSVAPINATYGGATYTPTARATSGLPVRIMVDPTSSSICSISAGLVSFIGVGTCILNADQEGNEFYGPASQVQQSFEVNAAGTTPICGNGIVESGEVCDSGANNGQP